MLGGAMGGDARQSPEPQQQSAPKPSASNKAGNPYDDLFGKMFDSGREVQKGYQQNMESIFDQYLQGMKRPK